MSAVKSEEDFKKMQKEVASNQNWIKGKLVQNCLAKNSNMGSKIYIDLIFSKRAV